jgi:hypothetical protein
MLVVADINTLWRSRPFEALSEVRPILGMQPMDPLIALRQRRVPWGSKVSRSQKMIVLFVVLPAGWATRRAPKAMPRLWSLAREACHSVGDQASALVVTSPHYAPLVGELCSEIPTFYYCSDDYTNYAGWKAEEMRQQECFIVQNARHSFFVSAALRDRAVNEYAIDFTRTSVSMNATDEEFLTAIDRAEIDRLLNRYPQAIRPITGIVGGINNRLDLELIGKVAESDAIGSVLLIGSVDTACNGSALDALRRNDKCIFTGRQPHHMLPVWLQALDVALIPFRHCRFNEMCSPMRLFDHLAGGRPIVATNACPQVEQFKPAIKIAASTRAFVELAAASCADACESSCEALRSLARQHTWRARANLLNAKIREF